MSMNQSTSARNVALLAGAIAATAATVGTSILPASAQDAIVQIDGSSTVFPITEAMAEEFQAANEGTAVVVGVSGTGGGFKKFCAGETDISGASRPIKDSEIELCEEAGISFIEVPVAYDALTVVINDENDWASTLTTDQLRTIWEAGAEGEITSWSQVDSGFPDVELALYAPGTDSGTFDYFNEAILEDEEGEELGHRGDYTASEDDNILVLGVQGSEGGIGYFGLAYYLENQDTLTSVGIDEGDGAVFPSSTTVEDGSYTPLSRPIFIYVREDSLDKPEVASFVEFYLADENRGLIGEVGYVPLPQEMYEQGRADVGM
ncbi:MAG: PstS family phosphate ABC transporter substrate-binding protein [Cyanobacteria bacterium P01_A01_bin.135]